MESFVNGLYGIFVDFNGCDGITELLWQAKFDEYRTFHQKQSHLLLVITLLYKLVKICY
jgi:hypothetical protein